VVIRLETFFVLGYMTKSRGTTTKMTIRHSAIQRSTAPVVYKFGFVTMTIRAFLSLALLAILCTAIALPQECEVGTDGSCIDDSCVDNHAKCEYWNSTGKSDDACSLFTSKSTDFFSKQLTAFLIIQVNATPIQYTCLSPVESHVGLVA
jgi:hypothetical protein